MHRFSLSDRIVFSKTLFLVTLFSRHPIPRCSLPVCIRVLSRGSLAILGSLQVVKRNSASTRISEFLFLLLFFFVDTTRRDVRFLLQMEGEVYRSSLHRLCGGDKRNHHFSSSLSESQTNSFMILKIVHYEGFEGKCMGIKNSTFKARLLS